MIQNHMRNAMVAEGVRAQLDLHLDRVRRALGAELVFVARVAGGERRVEAMSAAPGHFPHFAIGNVCKATECAAVREAALCDPVRFAGQVSSARASVTGDATEGVAFGIPVCLSSGTLFGVLGGVLPEKPEGLCETLRNFATVMSVGLDLIHDHETAAQRVRGMIGDVIRSEQFFPVFQPIVDLASGEVIYREGLTRVDPVLGGTVPQLLEAAHSVGMGPQLELAFARSILAADRDWGDNAGISINLSETTLHSDLFADFLANEAEAGLLVELTEHEPVRDYPGLAHIVTDMRSAGLALAIDDAGAGYTSLRHILDLKPDVLKMDGYMSARVDSDPEALSLMRFLQAYCDDTGALLVVEGIERSEQLAALAGAGVRYVQGYHIGQPRRTAAMGGEVAL